MHFGFDDKVGRFVKKSQKTVQRSTVCAIESQRISGFCKLFVCHPPTLVSARFCQQAGLCSAFVVGPLLPLRIWGWQLLMLFALVQRLIQISPLFFPCFSFHNPNKLMKQYTNKDILYLCIFPNMKEHVINIYLSNYVGIKCPFF